MLFPEKPKKHSALYLHFSFLSQQWKAALTLVAFDFGGDGTTGSGRAPPSWPPHRDPAYHIRQLLLLSLEKRSYYLGSLCKCWLVSTLSNQETALSDQLVC